jgi:hypothetical protein
MFFRAPVQSIVLGSDWMYIAAQHKNQIGIALQGSGYNVTAVTMALSGLARWPIFFGLSTTKAFCWRDFANNAGLRMAGLA